MKMYEYEAKRVFADHNIEIPAGKVASTPQEVREKAEEIGFPVTLKSQVLTGGRGKAGGIKFAEDGEEAHELARELLGAEIRGFEVEALLVEEKLEIEEEYYLGLTVDREGKKPALMLSSEGGVDIEEVAASSPEKIIRTHLEPGQSFELYRARELAEELELPGHLLNKLGLFIRRLSLLYREVDAHTAEINPLALTPEGFVAADAKLVIDEDALFRQKGFEKDEEDLPYVELDGDVGCIVNGAGLAMSTMDTLMELGGEPANFLDIGGGASAEVMARALARVSEHPDVKSIFINILGGITRCDEVARGILQSIGEIDIPVVVRLRGTNEEEGTELLRENDIEVETDMKNAAEQALAAAEE